MNAYYAQGFHEARTSLIARRNDERLRTSN